MTRLEEAIRESVANHTKLDFEVLGEQICEQLVRWLLAQVRASKLKKMNECNFEFVCPPGLKGLLIEKLEAAGFEGIFVQPARDGGHLFLVTVPAEKIKQAQKEYIESMKP